MCVATYVRLTIMVFEEFQNYAVIYVHLVLQIFAHQLPNVVPLQTNHQDLCGGLCPGLGPYSCLCPHFTFLG